MSNKSSVVPPQHHKDIHELFAEQKMREAQKKQDDELKRQKELVKTILMPFLEEKTKSITDCKVLINNTLKTLNEAFKQKMQEEQERLSETTIDKLDISERLERDKGKDRERSVIETLKGERIAAAVSILGAVHVAIAGTEAKENDLRKVSDLKIEV